MSPLEAALQRLKIGDVWRLLALRGDPPERDRTVCSPFRDDKDPSFSIFDNGRRWKDHGTGEQGNAVDFLAKARGLSNGDACRELIRLAGTAHHATGSHNSNNNHHRHDEDKDKALKRAKWPEFRTPSQLGIETVAELRGLSPEGVSLAVERGLLFTAKTEHGQAWVITDSRRLIAQARRFDGRDWAHIKGKKAWTLPGSIGAIPIGLHETIAFKNIVLVEGGPDLLSAHHLMWCSRTHDLGVVAMLGASNHIPNGELSAFHGKRVRIFAHLDDEGLKAEGRWWRQLKEAGAIVDGFDFTGLVRSDRHRVADLNDFCLIDVDQWEAERETIEGAFNFQPNREE
jgi:hypothetical protein